MEHRKLRPGVLTRVSGPASQHSQFVTSLLSPHKRWIHLSSHQSVSNTPLGSEFCHMVVHSQTEGQWSFQSFPYFCVFSSHSLTVSWCCGVIKVVLNMNSCVKFILDIDTVLYSERDEMVVIHDGVFYHVLTWWIHSMIYAWQLQLYHTHLLLPTTYQ